MSNILKGILFAALILSRLSLHGNDLDPRQTAKWPDYVRGAINDFTIEGNYAYLALAYTGVMILDISDPRDPKRLGWFDTPGIAYHAAARGNAIYVADGKIGGEELDSTIGLIVVDAQDKTSPRIVRTITSTNAKAVHCVGDHLIVIGQKLEIFDIRDPLDPQLIGESPFNGTGIWLNVRIVADGPTLFISNNELGFEIFDISNPRSPRRLGGHDTPARAMAIATFANYVYVGDSSVGIQIFDVSDPTAPRLVRTLPEVGFSAEVHGSLLIGGSSRHIEVFDLADPSNPQSLEAIS